MRFTEAAKKAFSFLENDGFRLTGSDPLRLRFESRQSFITIQWDDRSGELNVFLGPQPRRGESRDAFSLTDLLDMQGVDLPERKMPFQVAEESKLTPFLNKLAADTQRYAQPALAGDRMFFHRLRSFRNTRAQASMQEMELRRVRAEAELAWQRRDLDKLIGLYTSIEGQLTASERAKLAYAMDHQAR